MTRELDSRRPGSRLRAIARVVFDADTLARVVLPTIADMQHEVAEATDAAEARRAAWRGYRAFWTLVALSPVAFNDWPGRRQLLRSMILVGALAVLAGVAFGAESRLMRQWLIGLGLHGRIASVGDVAPYSWLPGLLVVAFMGLVARRSPFRTAPASVLLVSGATILASVSYGAAAFVAKFAGIGARGSAGLMSVTGAVDALAFPTLAALGLTATAALGVAVSQWRASRATALHPPDAAAGVSPLLIAGALVVSLLVVNHWLRLNESLLDTSLNLLLFPRAQAAGLSARDLAGRTELAIPLVLLGWLLAIVMVVAALATWRGRSNDLRHPLIQWTTRAALVAILAGCVWHGRIISGMWQEFRSETARLVNQPSPR